jgi:putative transposase
VIRFFHCKGFQFSGSYKKGIKINQQTMRRKNRRPKELFYVELRLAGKVPLLIQPLFREKMISGLKWSCEKRGLRIYDYSILPDRIIMIANTAWGTLRDVLEAYKDFTSKAVMLILRNGNPGLETAWTVSVFQEYGPKEKQEGIHIWEEELFLQSLFQQDDIDKCALDIQNRAVKLGYVANPEHYIYCSANPRNPLDGWIVEATDPWS